MIFSKQSTHQPTIKSVIASYSSLCFSLSIFGLSCRTAGITILGKSSSGGGNFLWPLLMSLFEPIFMSVLLTKTLLLYPFVFPMSKFKSLGSMYICLCPLKNLPLITHVLTPPDTSQYRCQQNSLCLSVP